MEKPEILLVEDDAIDSRLLGDALSGMFDMEYAVDGLEALAALEKSKPALILLDLRLPNLDGFGVLQKVRSRTDGLKDVPILVVSNLDQESDKERARSLGANAYLVKAEVSVDVIREKMKELLGISSTP